MNHILIIILLVLSVCSCTPKPSNEISEMALECFRNKQGITITFTPQPETKEAQKVEHK